MFDVITPTIPPRVLDRAGLKHFRLRVVTFSHTTKKGAYWWCQCDCGIYRLLLGVFNQNTRSCGCLQRERSKDVLRKIATTHGMTKHKLHGVYWGMMARCSNPANNSFANYGGRGISVCRDWTLSPESFFQWALANGYAAGLQIDRVNNDGEYSPSNCRWVTSKQNSSNRRSNIMITHNGKTKTCKEWADEVGLAYGCLRGRLKLGWPVGLALETPSSPSNRRKLYESDTSLTAVAAR